MPYIAGDGSAAQPIKTVLIGNGAGGTVPVLKIMAGDGSVDRLVWEGKKKFRDEFELVNAYLGANWEVVGTSPWLLYQDTGFARCFGNTTDGSRPSMGTWVEETATWGQYAKAELANAGSTGVGTWLQVHSRGDSDSFMGLQLNDSTLTLFNNPGGGAASITRGTASETRVAGKQLELRAEPTATPNVFTYRGLVNGVQKITWTDTSNVVPKPSTNKRVGWGSRTNRSFGSTKYAPALAWWEGGDI